MFEHEWAALFRMTIDADFPGCLTQHRLIVGAVRVVTIRALHQSFRNAMVCWQRKLRLKRRMAGVTQLRLRLPEQALVEPPVFFRDPW